jgi:hypothetical protein
MTRGLSSSGLTQSVAGRMRLGLAACWLALWSPLAGNAATKGTEVVDPHYGEALFYFYQERYFSALTTLMTAEHFGRLPHQADDAELLRGGILLSYGMHVEAGRIFERLIAEKVAPSVRDRAWYYLAKIRYQRAYYPEAEQALAHIEGPLPGDLESERRVLQALVLMQRGAFREATQVLIPLQGSSDWARYARYNLGVAMVRSGEMESGISMLEALGREGVKTEELASLRDKVNVALAYTLLGSNHPDEAQKYLTRVRLQGLMSSKALLGMGWTYMAAEKPDRALVYWQELRGRDVLDAAVQESMLAVPFALGKLGAWRESLQHYEEAGDTYTREIKRIDQSIGAIQAGRLIDAILRENVSEEAGWMWRITQLPEAPETHYLLALMAGHDFQEALKSFRDLQFLAARLDQSLADIGVFGDMLDTRRQAFRERLPVALGLARERDAEAYTVERDRLAARVDQIEKDEDVTALATAKEHEQLSRLQAMEATIRRARDTDPETVERWRLLNGVLAWDLNQAYPDRLWQVRRTLRALDKALDDSRSWREALARSRNTVPGEFEAFAGRIRDLPPRIRALQARTRDLTRQQAAYLSDLAVAELTRQRERLATYLTQVRFAVAQIYDQSSGEPGRGKPDADPGGASRPEATP